MNYSADGKARRALISVFDKTGLEAFAKKLSSLGVEILSTGGTAEALTKAGLAITQVSDVTSFPEILDGRVKTLHPLVHGALLAKPNNVAHQKAMSQHKITPIDILVVNLYPFAACVASGKGRDEIIENIDIGGPAMIRAAAKNHAHVAVVTDSLDYEAVLKALDSKEGISMELRRRLAHKAFAKVSSYDSAISSWFAETLSIAVPSYRTFGGVLKQELRYGENPHQRAGLYGDPLASHGGEKAKGTIVQARLLQGKALSYNNIADGDVALRLVSSFSQKKPACAIIKHANPCGVGVGDDMEDAYAKALACDKTSAFGGIVAVNGLLDAKVAARMLETFTEVIVAPVVDKKARALLAGKKNLRVLETGSLPSLAQKNFAVHSVTGGWLIQEEDTKAVHKKTVRQVSQRAPSDRELDDLLFAFMVAKYVKSNAIVCALNQATTGIGAGQMSRVDSSMLAVRKALLLAGGQDTLPKGTVAASDAFFPFADGIEYLAKHGVRAVIQPGGSVRDGDVIAVADAYDMAMLFTDIRHFYH